ncbi:hypothetical protein E4T56_gene5221 [Termitomyces sp. T112]|nr:hypothetical protein E4T56_gene5221 [Termitomyces sp. T112]
MDPCSYPTFGNRYARHSRSKPASPPPITQRPMDKQNEMTGVQNSPLPNSPTTTCPTLNNMPHSATGVSPFYANKGYNPRLTLSLKDISSHVTHKVTEDLQSLHQFL